MRQLQKNPDDCGNCKHWHEWPKEKQMSKIRCGDCDKIRKGAPFEWTDRHGKNHITPYAGWSFEDENYNDDFRCFEPAEGGNMIPTREQLEEARHVLFHTYGHFTAFCNLNRSCEECDRIIRFGCIVKQKIENLQTKRILRICKPEPPKEE